MTITAEINGTYDYTAFGNQLEATDTTNPFRYCGEYYDEESGLTYLRNRYYNSTTGRFITEDPAKDGSNWYVYGNNAPIMFVDSLGLYSIPLRSAVEKAGGTINWTGNASRVEINGYSRDFYVGDNYSTYIDSDGTMFVEDICVNNMIYAPKGQAKRYYDMVTDDFGKYVLRTWLDGDGSDQKVGGNSWDGFIKYNYYVKERLSWLVPQAINYNQGIIYNVSDTNLSGSDGGYASGIDLINGANMEVGGFIINGRADKVNNDIYNVNISYDFNDIIDANGKYRSDTIFSMGASVLGYKCNDYKLQISGHFSFRYSLKYGLLY